MDETAHNYFLVTSLKFQHTHVDIWHVQEYRHTVYCKWSGPADKLTTDDEWFTEIK